MKRNLALFALFALIVGCSSLLVSVHKAEYAAATMADAAMKEWVLYYKAATNDPPKFNTTMEKLEQQRAEVDATARKVGASLATVRDYEKAYQTNSAVPLQAAVAALQAVTSDLSNLVGLFTGKTNAVTSP